MAEAGEDAIATAIPINRVRPPRSSWTKIAIVATVLALLVLGVFLYLSKNAPPEAARLLPESDGIVYLDAGLLRTATHFDTHPVKHDPDYQRFIDSTGIEFERDLGQAAFALHLMPNPLGANGPVAFSSIFVGKFDRLRLANYLTRIAQSQELYAGRAIYNVPVEGRTDRIAILDSHTVAVSNTPTAEQIHSILDRQRTALLPFSGNSLLSQHFKDVPLFSSAWGIGKLGAALGDNLKLFGFRIPLSVDAIFIGSVRWTGALHLRIEEIAPNGPAATLSADSIEALLSMARAAENALPNAVTNPDAKSLLDSVEIEHHNDRAVLTATVPLALLQKLGSGAKD
jgi:hypothetical protein